MTGSVYVIFLNSQNMQNHQDGASGSNNFRWNELKMISFLMPNIYVRGTN